MNAQKTSTKRFARVAITLVAGSLLIAAIVIGLSGRAFLHAGTPSHVGQPMATSSGESPALQLQSLILRGAQFRDEGRYKESRPLLDEALTLAQRAFGTDSIEVAAVLNQQGMLGKYDGHFDEAESAYVRALQIMEKTAGPAHPLTATLFHNRGGLEHARGRFAAGEPYARRSVEIREQMLGTNHPDTAADVAALAALLDGQRNTTRRKSSTAAHSQFSNAVMGPSITKSPST